MCANCFISSDTLPHIVLVVEYPNGRKTDVDFLVDTGSPTTYLSYQKAVMAEIDLSLLSHGKPHGPMVKDQRNTRILQGVKFTMPRVTTVTADVLIFEDQYSTENLLGMDLIRKLGNLVVTKTGVWFSI